MSLMSLPTQSIPVSSANSPDVIALQILCLGKASSRRDPGQENHHGSSLGGVFHPSAPQGARGHGPRAGFPLSSRLRLQARTHPEEPAVAQPRPGSTAGAGMGSPGAPTAWGTPVHSHPPRAAAGGSAQRPVLGLGSARGAEPVEGRQQLKAQHFVKSINENIYVKQKKK